MSEFSKKERPILFSDEMVRAILDGRKTQTRRVVKPEPTPPPARACKWKDNEWLWESNSGKQGIFYPNRFKCPFGASGDNLWVRESWRIDGWPGEGPHTIGYRDGSTMEDRSTGWEDNYEDWYQRVWDQSCDDCESAGLELDENDQYPRPCNGFPTRWRPSIHMPRWASRITLEVTGVRVERLQDISEEDANREGMMFHDGRGIGHSGWRWSRSHGVVYPTCRIAFSHLWGSINGADSWNENPWVWVVEFRVVEK